MVTCRVSETGGSPNEESLQRIQAASTERCEYLIDDFMKNMKSAEQHLAQSGLQGKQRKNLAEERWRKGVNEEKKREGKQSEVEKNEKNGKTGKKNRTGTGTTLKAQTYLHVSIKPQQAPDRSPENAYYCQRRFFGE